MNSNCFGNMGFQIVHLQLHKVLFQEDRLFGLLYKKSILKGWQRPLTKI